MQAAVPQRKWGNSVSCRYLSFQEEGLLRGWGLPLVVQWLKLHASAPSPEDMGSIPSQGTGSHTTKLKSLHTTTKILQAAMKIKDPAYHN